MLVQCSYSGEVLQQGGKVFELAGHKDVKVEGGWMAPSRVVGVWAWSEPPLLLQAPKVRAAHCSLLLLLHRAPADEDYNLPA